MVENEIICIENCDCFFLEYLFKNINNLYNVYIMDDVVLIFNVFIFVFINNFIFFFKFVEVLLVIVLIMFVCYMDMFFLKIICYFNLKLRVYV